MLTKFQKELVKVFVLGIILLIIAIILAFIIGKDEHSILFPICTAFGYSGAISIVFSCVLMTILPLKK